MGKRGKKELIDAAAVELFATKGLNGSTVKDIAAKAGVSEGALYRHYKSKEEMAQMLFQAEKNKLNGAIFSILGSSCRADQKINDVVSYIYGEYKKSPYNILFLTTNFHQLNSTIEVFSYTENIYDMLIYFLKDFFGKYSPEKDHQLAATLMVGIVMEPIVFHHYKRLEKHPVEYVEQISSICCQLFGVRNEGF